MATLSKLMQTRELSEKLPKNPMELADKYISLTQGQVVYSLNNSFPLTQTSAWNTDKYSGKHYTGKTTFPLINLVNKDEGLIFISETKLKHLSDEIFTEYLSNPSLLS